MSFRIEEWQVMQAWKNGASIESTSRVHPNWVLTTEPTWNWGYNDYRIANLTADGIRLDELVGDCQDRIEVSFGNEISSIGTIGGLIRTLCESPEDIPRFKIKHKEKKLRPWTMEEFKQYRDEWFVAKGADVQYKVGSISKGRVILGNVPISFEEMMNQLTLEDGSPCGVLE